MKIVCFVTKEYKDIIEMTLPYMPTKNLELISLDPSKNIGVYGDESFSLLGKDYMKQIAEIMKQMKYGELLMNIDADVLINASTLWFERQLGEHDMIFQSDQGEPCTGLFVARVSSKVIEAIELTADGTSGHQNCQIIFNRLRPSFGLDIALFDTKDVWNYGVLNRGVWNGEEFELPYSLKAFHANFTVGPENKKRLLSMAIQKYKYAGIH